MRAVGASPQRGKMAVPLGEQDIYLFREGTHAALYAVMGCRLDAEGATFRVWAPNAVRVSVIGEWNGWSPSADPLVNRGDESGIWEGAVRGVRQGQAYKFRIATKGRKRTADKADPFAFFAEAPPATASRAWTLDYEWGDGGWMAARRDRNALAAPISIYEVHLGSWRRKDPSRLPSYRDIAQPLADYVAERGFTHVELMPLTEHPFYGSWGYQTTGYFAPTARYGTPQDLMYLIDILHQRGIGVILDWVPSHFPDDPHGLGKFDGTHLYEHADPRLGFHPEWKSLIFNYDCLEVRAFLVSSALFWLSQYHIDGLRVDAVASMLYLDYGRKEGEWLPNAQGGRENLGAIDFLRQLNESAYRDFPDIQMIAEESTAWPLVSRPVSDGGLGFGMKWNMGWMHDTLDYMRNEPIHRKYHHDRLTFSIWYAFTENFVLALSHDEVVYGKGSLIGKMPGDRWQQFANLRALYGHMWAHPGKKLLFMGCEFAQRREWAHEGELDWAALDNPEHAGVQRWISDLNALLRAEPALYELDFAPQGFQWIDVESADTSVVASCGTGVPAAPCSSSATSRRSRVSTTSSASPSRCLGGGPQQRCVNLRRQWHGQSRRRRSAPVPAHGHFQSLTLTLPPLATLVLRPADR